MTHIHKWPIEEHGRPDMVRILTEKWIKDNHQNGPDVIPGGITLNDF
ncbi:MAG: hypothetical protein WBN26_06405 [Muriicola sp.]